ncbi:MAG: ATP synthase subunit C [Nitrososphaerota archaeon]|nr:ATP synthase subunit C [Nitrososphaerales archaeon]MDW8045148.1 ATP synthase subunit C [Nitrososphaerota archaeon]
MTNSIRLPIMYIALLAIFPIVLTNLAYAGSAEPLAEASKFMSMAISVGLASVGAGYALGKTGAASIASITEKAELFGRTIIYVGMAEGIAIYGLLISFLVWIS